MSLLKLKNSETIGATSEVLTMLTWWDSHFLLGCYEPEPEPEPAAHVPSFLETYEKEN